ncbi:DUF3987 domain-containing protein [Methylobacterium sp. Leaf118]|uniref:DUF3987 domain-containing protein n=1 Tax=Methylobacterium sp. Leaf118 TaxID=2876562 RepID=UPI001E3B933A|nr:DUF3987 domain-containing protein [Methylobacterium sp. Leaf118]
MSAPFDSDTINPACPVVETEAGVRLTEATPPGHHLPPISSVVRPVTRTILATVTPEGKAGEDTGPDLGFLDTAMRPVPSFPLDALPAGVRDLIAGMAQGQRTHPAFLVTSVLATLAAAVGTSAHLQINAEWREPSAMWALLVGASGSGKSVSMRQTVNVLTEIGLGALRQTVPDPNREAVAQMVRAEQLRRTRRKIREGLDQDEVDFSSYRLPEAAAPPPGLITCTSTTLSGILDKLQAQPRGLLLAQADVIGLLRGATLRSDEGRAALLQGYDGDPYVRERANGAQILPALLLSLCGGVQPDKLKHVVGHEDDGLFARSLVTYPQIVRDTDLPSRSAPATKRFEGVLRQAYALPASPSAFGGHPVLITEHAWRAVGPASRRWAAEASETTGMLASTYNRATTQALRLAFVLAILDHALADKAGLPPSVGDAYVRSAIRLLDENYLPSAERALDAAQARPDPDADLRAIAIFIARAVEGFDFNVRELREARRAPCYRDRAAWEKAVDRLLRLGCIAEAPRRNRTGRTRADYQAHPAFLSAARKAWSAASA